MPGHASDGAFGLSDLRLATKYPSRGRVGDSLNAMAVWLANDDHMDLSEDGYKINRTLVFNTLKVQLGRWLLKALPTVRQE